MLFSRRFLLPALFVGFLVAPIARAVTLETLHSFGGKADGAYPDGGFASDAAGTLYGIAGGGGSFDGNHCSDGCGTIFTFDPGNGKFATVHRFTAAEGLGPNAPLASGGGKVFYGSAGAFEPSLSGGGGTIFEFDAGTNTLTVLYRLTGDNKGLIGPSSPVTLANNGLYGGTMLGGSQHDGGIYRFDLKTKAFRRIYTFGGANAQKLGDRLYLGMVVGKDGMLYGATEGGGPKGSGVLFRIDPKTQLVTPLAAISDPWGGSLSSPLAVGPTGEIFGTTAGGQTAPMCNGFCPGPGTVFKFNPKTLAFTILHTFDWDRDGVSSPDQSIAIGANGATLFGIADMSKGLTGAVYRMNLASGKVTDVYDFTGIAPTENPILVNAFSLALRGGKIYGTTGIGGYTRKCGNTGCGTVFQLTP